MSEATHVWRSLEEVPPGPSVATVGFFDGVHRGHQRIVGRAIEDADRRGVRSVAVTFDRHPMEVVRPGSQPSLLMTLERRILTLLGTGIDHVLVLPFTEELSQLPPGGFVDRVLVDALAVEEVVVGDNFRFGHRAAGDTDTLRELGERSGFGTVPVDLLELDGTTVSSTEIRDRIADGDVEWAREGLGRPYALDGTVVRGEGRGRRIGVPTANVEVSDRMCFPAHGIYAGYVRLEGDGEPLPAATNVGVRPTFGGETVTVEAHLLGFEGDLYGMHVSVSFTHRLRDEERFDSVDELVTAMRADIEQAARLLRSDATDDPGDGRERSHT